MDPCIFSSSDFMVCITPQQMPPRGRTRAPRWRRGWRLRRHILPRQPRMFCQKRPPMRLLLFIVAASCSTTAGLVLGTRLSEKWETRRVALMSEASVDHDEEGKTRTAQRLGAVLHGKLQACAFQIGLRAKWVYCRFYMSLDSPSADERRERSKLLLEAEATRRSSVRLGKQRDSWEEQFFSEAPGSAAELACAEACYQADLRSKAELQGANALLRQFLERCSRSYFSEAEILARREAFARLPSGTIAGLETQFLPKPGDDECLAEGAVMPISISSTAAPMTLAEQVQVLKSQLGLKGGSVAEVVRQAAVQLGVEQDSGRPLIEVAASCMQVLGVPEREGSG